MSDAEHQPQSWQDYIGEDLPQWGVVQSWQDIEPERWQDIPPEQWGGI